VFGSRMPLYIESERYIDIYICIYVYIYIYQCFPYHYNRGVHVLALN